MKYIVDKIEEAEARSGLKYRRADLSQDDKLWVGVAIFDGFPSNLAAGMEVEGEISEKQYMGKPSYTLNPPKKATGPGPNFKEKKIEAVMERKEKSIDRFQDSKEHSIKVASTFRAAIDCALAEFGTLKKPEQNADQLLSLYEKWRETLWFAFDAEDGNGNPKYPPFK